MRNFIAFSPHSSCLPTFRRTSTNCLEIHLQGNNSNKATQDASENVPTPEWSTADVDSNYESTAFLCVINPFSPPILSPSSLFRSLVSFPPRCHAEPGGSLQARWRSVPALRPTLSPASLVLNWRRRDTQKPESCVSAQQMWRHTHTHTHMQPHTQTDTGMHK